MSHHGRPLNRLIGLAIAHGICLLAAACGPDAPTASSPPKQLGGASRQPDEDIVGTWRSVDNRSGRDADKQAADKTDLIVFSADKSYRALWAGETNFEVGAWSLEPDMVVCRSRTWRDLHGRRVAYGLHRRGSRLVLSVSLDVGVLGSVSPQDRVFLRQ